MDSWPQRRLAKHSISVAHIAESDFVGHDRPVNTKRLVAMDADRNRRVSERERRAISALLFFFMPAAKFFLRK